MKTIKLLAALGIIALLFTSGCSSKDDQKAPAEPETTTSLSEIAAEAVWTCSMHPEIRESKPGLCPKCNMPLILVK